MDRTRPETLRANERIKFASSITGNLGAVLLATSFGQWYLNGMDAFVLLWLLTALMLIWSAWYMLILLEVEDEQ